MRGIEFTLIGLMMLASITVAEKITYDDDVLVLTDSNLDLVLSSYDSIIINFYTSWCDYCKILETEYARAAKLMHSQKPSCAFAKLNVEEQKATAEKYGINAYPTMILLRDQRLYEYTGGHTKDEIVWWVRRATGPTYLNITSAEEFKLFRENSTVLPVFYGSHQGDAFKKFEEVSKHLLTDPTYQFLVADSQLAKLNNQPFDGSTIIYNKYDIEEKVSNDIDIDQLKFKIEMGEFPAIAKFDERFAEKIFRNKAPVLLLGVRGSEADNKAKAELERMASQIRGTILIGLINAEEKIGLKMLKFLNLEATQLPAIRIIETGGAAAVRHRLTGEITGESIVKFVNEYQKGASKGTAQSQEMPKKKEEPAKNVNSSPARGSKDASANAGGEPKVAKAQQPKPQHNKASSTEL